MNNLLALMGRWHTWRGRKPIRVHVKGFRDDEGPVPVRPTGCLLTGGIDSLFTVFRHKDEIGTIINVVHSAGSEDTAITAKPDPSLQTFSKHQGMELVTIETNMLSAYPEETDALASMAHGAGYAAAGHFLEQSVGKLLISSSFTYDQLRPWGSHPDTDRLLSSASLTVDHIGAETNRFEKLRLLSTDPHFTQHLSICEHGPQPGDHQNCSECQKCLRTMIGLDLLGISPEDAPTFDWSDYRPEKLKTFLLPGHVNCSEMLEEAQRLNRSDIVDVLTDVIDYSQKYHWIVRIELFLRKRLAAAGRHKAFLKRVRHFIYNLLNIKFRTLETRSELHDK